MTGQKAVSRSESCMAAEKESQRDLGIWPPERKKLFSSIVVVWKNRIRGDSSPNFILWNEPAFLPLIERLIVFAQSNGSLSCLCVSGQFFGQVYVRWPGGRAAQRCFSGSTEHWPINSWWMWEGVTQQLRAKEAVSYGQRRWGGGWARDGRKDRTYDWEARGSYRRGLA